MSELVSILIPCHNAAPWLAQTLESALAQTWPHTEIILIDDGSTDDSREIARSFEARSVRVLTQPKRGASAARNAGMREARGGFIQFLDADDLLTPDKIDGQVALLQQRGRDFVASCRWGRFGDVPSAARFVDQAVFRDFAPMDFLLLHVGECRMMHPAAWLVPRDLAERAGGWNETLSLNDDGEYFARVVLASHGIVRSPVGAALYRSQLRDSLSRRRDPFALKSLVRSAELIAGHMLHAENTPRVRRALADYWQRLEYELYPDAPEFRGRAAAEVRALGGSALQPEMGARLRLLARLFGWKLARRIHRLLYP